MHERESSPATDTHPERKLSSFLASQCESLFDAMAGLDGVLFATADGEPVAGRVKEGMERSRLAAMSSSLVALGETMAKATEQRECEYAIVQNSDGYVVSLRIGKRLLPTAFARKDTNLGMLLSRCRYTAENVSANLMRKPDTGGGG